MEMLSMVRIRELIKKSLYICTYKYAKISESFFFLKYNKTLEEIMIVDTVKRDKVKLL